MAPLTDETKDHIALLYDSEGKNPTEIHRLVGVSKPTVYRVLREYELMPSASEEETGAEIEEAIYEKEAEDTDGELAPSTESEDEEEEYVPAEPIVLYNRGSAFAGLVLGVGLGAAVLYGAMMRGIVGPPPAGGSGTG